MRAGGGDDQKQQRQQFEKEQERQLEAMDLGATGLGLDVKGPQQEAGNLAAAEAVPQDIDRRKRRQGGQGNQGKRISEERNHAGTIRCMASNSPSEFSRSSAIRVVIWAPHWRQASLHD